MPLNTCEKPTLLSKRSWIVVSLLLKTGVYENTFVRYVFAVAFLQPGRFLYSSHLRWLLFNWLFSFHGHTSSGLHETPKGLPKKPVETGDWCRKSLLQAISHS